MGLQFGALTLLAVLFLILFAGLFFLGMAWYHRRRLEAISLRSLPAIESLKAGFRRAAEMGQSVHLSPGTGTLNQRSGVAETIAGLEAVDGAAREALTLGVPVQVTTNDALVNLVAEKSLQSAWRDAGRPEGIDADTLLVVQQDPVAYAAGVMEILGRSDLQGNMIVGDFGEELLLIGEVGAQETNFQVAGAARPSSMSFLPLVTDDYLLGEEVFAAGAYLDPRSPRIVSLLVQDVIRVVLLLLIVLGVLLATVGVLDGTLGRLFQMPVP